MMAGLAERSLDRAIKGLLQRRRSLHMPSQMTKKSINWRNRSTRTDLKFWLRFQPVASDLRRVISAIKLSPNIERGVAIRLTNIAKRARKLNRHPPLPEVQMIVPILCARYVDVQGQHKRMRGKYRAGPLGLQPRQATRRYESRCKHEIALRMMEDSEQLRGYFNLILIFAPNCTGDHATNIAEDAVYTAVAEDAGTRASASV